MITSSVDNIAFVVAEITFKFAVFISSVAKIAFVVVVITSSVVKITFVVSEITFKVARTCLNQN